MIWVETFKDTEKALKTYGDKIDIALLDYNLPDAPDGEAIDIVVNYGIPSIIFTVVIEVTQNIAQVNQAAQETNSGSQKVYTSAKNLSKLAKNLSEMVNKFIA